MAQRPPRYCRLPICVTGRNDTIVPAPVLRSIAAHLGAHLSGYGVALANTINPIHLSVQVKIDVRQMTGGDMTGLIIEHLHASDPRQELDILLRAPLAGLPAPDRPAVILIDSLDEALTYAEAHETYTLYHQSLRDYLLDGTGNRDFWCSPTSAHGHMAGRYLTHHTSQWAGSDGYGLRHSTGR